MYNKNSSAVQPAQHDIHVAPHEGVQHEGETMVSGISMPTRDKIGGTQHTEVHAAVKPVRFKVAGRKVITTAEQLDAAIQELVATTDFNERELRAALKDHLTGQYPAGEFARNRTEALEAALAFTDY